MRPMKTHRACRRAAATTRRCTTRAAAWCTRKRCSASSRSQAASEGAAMTRSRLLAACLLFVAAGAAAAQEQPRAAAVTTEQLAPDLHVLFGAGGGQVSGNVLALTTPQATLVVDSGYTVHVPKYREAIAALRGGPITHVVNTPWHD